MTVRSSLRRAASIALTPLLLAVPATTAFGADLVDLTLRSDARRFSSGSPRQEVRREFVVARPGVLTVVYAADPWYEAATLGGYGLALKDGSRMQSVRDAVRLEKTVGKTRTVTSVHLVYAPVTKSFEVVLTAPGVGDAAHVFNQGTQYACVQRLTVTFAPMGQAVQPGGPPAEADLAGTWRYDRGGGETITFTKRADGLYDVVENGYGAGRGTASVSGRIVTYEYANTKAFGSQKSGTYVLEVSREGDKLAGAWMTDNQEHGDTWLTRTTPAPIEPEPRPPEPVKPEPDPSGPAKPEPVEPVHPDPVPVPGGSSQEPVRTTRFTVQAGVRRVKSGETVFVPLFLLNPGGIANLNAVVTFAPAVARVQGKVVRGNALGPSLFEANATEPGTVRVGFASSVGLSESGTLAQIPFEAVGKPGDRAVLRVVVTIANAAAGTKGEPETIDGMVIVVGPDGEVPGDADGDGVLTAADALSALKMSVKLLPERLVLDMDKDGTVTSSDARLILLQVVGR